LHEVFQNRVDYLKNQSDLIQKNLEDAERISDAGVEPGGDDEKKVSSQLSKYSEPTLPPPNIARIKNIKAQLQMLFE